MAADPHLQSILKRKQADIEAYIRDTEKRLKQARTDLAHVNATLLLFEVEGERRQFPAYISLATMFSRGELPRLCKEALAAHPEGLDSRELARHVMAAKGWDADDRPLLTSVTQKIVRCLDELWRRKGAVQNAGKRAGVNLWRVKAN